MPLIKVQTSAVCPDEKKKQMALELSRICAEGIGKPESYVASVFEDNAAISFGGELAEGAFVEVKSIGGLNADVNTTLSSTICRCLESNLGIPGSKVYINFTDVERSDWGWNGRTF